MLRKFFVAIIVVMIFIFSASPTSKSFAAEVSKLKATGIALPPSGQNFNSNFVRRQIFQAAKADAQRRLFEALNEFISTPIVKRSAIDDETVATTLHVDEKILSYLKNFRVTEIKFNPEGYCEVIMEAEINYLK